MLSFSSLASNEDVSVNFVAPFGRGALEARYVRREARTVICYLSSQSGCSRSCRMCHLTQTGQVSDDEAGIEQFVQQAQVVLDHYARRLKAGAESPGEVLHFNYMARGEPFENSVIRGRFSELRAELDAMARARGLTPIHLVSTIMPSTAADLDLERILPAGANVRLFYSLYSVLPEFRRRWLPKAADPLETLRRLAAWQQATKGELVIHHAVIAGENDDRRSLDAMTSAIEASGINARFNLVRYNPPARGGMEASDLDRQEMLAALSSVMRTPGSRVVPRVGFDVSASCGMFVSE